MKEAKNLIYLFVSCLLVSGFGFIAYKVNGNQVGVPLMFAGLLVFNLGGLWIVMKAGDFFSSRHAIIIVGCSVLFAAGLYFALMNWSIGEPMMTVALILIPLIYLHRFLGKRKTVLDFLKVLWVISLPVTAELIMTSPGSNPYELIPVLLLWVMIIYFIIERFKER